MPSDEEVTPRAGSLRSMTGLTEAECTALLPHFECALVGSMGSPAPSMGSPAPVGATRRIRPVPYPRWPTSCSSS
jgi:hypothetical protein